MSKILFAIVAVLLLSGNSPATDRYLSATEWEKDRKKLRGDWHTDSKAAVQFHFALVELEGRSEVAITLSDKPDDPHKVVPVAFHSAKNEKQRYFFAPRRLGSNEGTPRWCYRFEGETLILEIDKGALKGEHRLHRMRSVGSAAVRPIGHVAGLAELKSLEGKWTTVPKATVLWEIIFKLVRHEKRIVAGEVSVAVAGARPIKFGNTLTTSAFYSSPSGKRKFLMLSGLDDVLEYRIEGDQLIVSVPTGRGEGIHVLRRVN